MVPRHQYSLRPKGMRDSEATPHQAALAGQDWEYRQFKTDSQSPASG